MTQDIKTERRWLRSVIAASAEPLPVFPWMRGQRRKPVALQPQPTEVDETPVRRVPLFTRTGSVAAR